MGKEKLIKKNYWHAIFVIIPLIGFVVGILLLRKGIILKDKTRGYIGAAGIVFTIVFYAWVFYHGNYSTYGKEMKVSLTKMEITRTMKDIEIFKLGFGHYPDNLQELLNENRRVQIVDPLSEDFFSRESKPFNYIKIDSAHYTLFSSGLDQIPNTTDDVYPDISYTESKTFGFVKSDK
jgi:hypothetical protein